MGIRICPICNRLYTSVPALSRKDNKTKICPACGMNEAIQAMEKALKEKENNK